MQNVLGDIHGVGRECNLVRRGADANSHTILFARCALEVAHQEGHEVGGHLWCSSEFERVFPGRGARRVGLDGGVGDGRVAAVDDERNVIGGFEGRLVEAGEGAARVGGFKLGDGIVAASGF